jgi:predicted dehydrogenase
MVTEQKILGLVGCGYWGRNYVKILKTIEEIKLKWICDKNLDINDGVLENSKFTKDADDVFYDPEVDAVIIATPPATHYELAKKALENEKDVLIEKPMTCDSNLALKLMNLANEKSRIFLYNSAIKKLKDLIQNKKLGKIFYFYSRRASFGPIRKDVNSMWNLAPHDISIINFLTNKIPKKVSARGFFFLERGIEDVVDLVLEYEGGVSAFIHVSWLEPIKSRDMFVVGDKKSAYFNDLEIDKLKIFEKGEKEKIIKNDSQNSPLKEECLHFLKCITTREKPLTDGYNGYIITKILESAEKSLKNSGKIEEIS